MKTGNERENETRTSSLEGRKRHGKGARYEIRSNNYSTVLCLPQTISKLFDLLSPAILKYNMTADIFSSVVSLSFSVA